MTATTAPKAILAYAQLYAYGLPEDPMAAGMTEEIVQSVQIKVIGDVLNSYRQYPISEETAQMATTEYLTKLRMLMNIQTTLKVDDETNPVVELTASRLDNKGADKIAETDRDLIRLGTRLGRLRATGMTDEQIKADEDFQKFALDCLDKFTDKFPFYELVAIDVACQAVDGAEGKMYWAPVSPETVAKFVTGQI